MDSFDYNIFDSYLRNSNNEQGVFARFHDKWIKTGKIKENGMPEFVQKTYVEIKVKGSVDAPDKPATEEDMMRFPREYAFYKNKKEKQKEGTPLALFAFLTAPEVEACDLKGVYTVEDLARLTDEQAMSLNLLDGRNMARRFMLMARDNAAIAEFEAENERLKQKIATLEDEIKALKGETQNV